MSSTKPYLLRAIYEWAQDNGYTPQIIVDVEHAGVEVPLEFAIDGKIVLNVSPSAVQLHVMNNECVSFSARFNGIEHDIFAPMDAILAIFVRETHLGGMFFDEMPFMQDTSEADTQLEQIKSNTASKPSAAKIASDNSEGKSQATDSGKTSDKQKNKRAQSHLKVVK